jgi:hypothetical protein
VLVAKRTASPIYSNTIPSKPERRLKTTEYKLRNKISWLRGRFQHDLEDTEGARIDVFTFSPKMIANTAYREHATRLRSPENWINTAYKEL